MAKMTGSDFADKWGRRLSSATDDIRKGVEAVSDAPGKRAAAKKAKWVAKMSDPATQAKWAANVAAVPVDEWKKAVTEVGLGRISAGVTQAQSKMAKFGEQLLSYQESQRSKIDAMPDVTLADSKARMDAWFDIMSKFKPTK